MQLSKHVFNTFLFIRLMCVMCGFRFGFGFSAEQIKSKWTKRERETESKNHISRMITIQQTRKYMTCVQFQPKLEHIQFVVPLVYIFGNERILLSEQIKLNIQLMNGYNVTPLNHLFQNAYISFRRECWAICG